jgi:hypothetical protein
MARHLARWELDGVDGAVVVVDVIRAFSTAAYAFGAGAAEIFLVGSADDALEFKAANPGSLAMGEERGLRPDGFDFPNSPAMVRDADLEGRTLVQRTSAGTQGVVGAVDATGGEDDVLTSGLIGRARIGHQLDAAATSIRATPSWRQPSTSSTSRWRSSAPTAACGSPHASSPEPVESLLLSWARPFAGQAAVRRWGGAVVWTLPSGRVRVSWRLGPSSMVQPSLWMLA